MTEPPDNRSDNQIEGNLGNNRFRASGDAVEQLLRYIGPALVWPVIASAAAIVIIAVGFVLSWTVFRS
jgi:hypothetical protein